MCLDISFGRDNGLKSSTFRVLSAFQWNIVWVWMQGFFFFFKFYVQGKVVLGLVVLSEQRQYAKHTIHTIQRAASRSKGLSDSRCQECQG